MSLFPDEIPYHQEQKVLVFVWILFILATIASAALTAAFVALVVWLWKVVLAG